MQKARKGIPKSSLRSGRDDCCYRCADRWGSSGAQVEAVGVREGSERVQGREGEVKLRLATTSLEC
jgi:hypothetical protein